MRGAVEDGAGEVDAAEFAGGRETERDGAAGVAQALDVGECEAGDLVAEREARLGEGPAGDGVEFFHREWYAAEGLRDVGISRGFAGPLGVEERERVEIAGLDGGESGVQLLEGTAFAGSEGVDEGDGIAGPRLRLAVIAHGSGP